LINGRGSNVHSVGGDFREATWRAVRQGLMMLKEKGADRLLEPWYRFKLVVNQTEVGRALNDIQKMSGEFDPPQNSELSDMVILTGVAPVSEMRDYAQDVRSYTHGQGQLECIPDGFKPCHNADDVIEKINYQPVSDLENTPDSVFCAHGAGYPVAWDDVPKMAHVPYATNL
jgi:translation elongation factor EF-G